MFNNQNDAALDQEIRVALKELETLRDEPQKYDALMTRIDTLQSLKTPGLKPPSMDTMLIVGANIFGILWLTAYESHHMVRARAALGFVMKPTR